MASTRFINVVNFLAGSTPVTTVKEVTIDQKHKEIMDSGDADQYESFGARGAGSTSVNVTLSDPIQAHALKIVSGATVTFSGQPTSGSATTTFVGVTVVGFTGMGHSNKAMHNGLWAQSVPGKAFKADGTDPITFTAPTA